MFKLNYVMLYTGDIRDILADKLTMLFNRALLNVPIRLTLCIPEMFDIKRAKRYEDFFDEVNFSRFKPESSRFWNFRNITKYKQYCFSCNIESDDFNFYIDQQSIITQLPSVDSMKKYKIFYNGLIENDQIEGKYRAIIDILQKTKYNYPKDDKFICYDFSVCYFDDDIKKKLFFQLNDFIEKCSENQFFGMEETNILLSILLKDIPADKKLDLNTTKFKFDEKIIDNMYTLI